MNGWILNRYLFFFKSSSPTLELKSRNKITLVANPRIFSKVDFNCNSVRKES